MKIAIHTYTSYSYFHGFQAYCSEKLLEISSKCLDIIGAPAAAQNHWANEMHREAMRYVTLNESNDILKIIIALLGIRHAGVRFFSL